MRSIAALTGKRIVTLLVRPGVPRYGAPQEPEVVAASAAVGLRGVF